MLEFFLPLKPDLSHVDGYARMLLSTIIQSSENTPDWANAHTGQVVEVGVG